MNMPIPIPADNIPTPPAGQMAVYLEGKYLATLPMAPLEFQNVMMPTGWVFNPYSRRSRWSRYDPEPATGEILLKFDRLNQRQFIPPPPPKDDIYPYSRRPYELAMETTAATGELLRLEMSCNTLDMWREAWDEEMALMVGAEFSCPVDQLEKFIDALWDAKAAAARQAGDK